MEVLIAAEKLEAVFTFYFLRNLGVFLRNTQQVGWFLIDRISPFLIGNIGHKVCLLVGTRVRPVLEESSHGSCSVCKSQSEYEPALFDSFLVPDPAVAYAAYTFGPAGRSRACQHPAWLTAPR